MQSSIAWLDDDCRQTARRLHQGLLQNPYVINSVVFCCFLYMLGTPVSRLSFGGRASPVVTKTSELTSHAGKTVYKDYAPDGSTLSYLKRCETEGLLTSGHCQVRFVWEVKTLWQEARSFHSQYRAIRNLSPFSLLLCTAAILWTTDSTVSHPRDSGLILAALGKGHKLHELEG